jgi:hypothetical protein
MGLTLEFYLGDSEAIAKAVEDLDLEKLRATGIIKGVADFSLHIEPNDLDLLSHQLGQHSDQPPIELRPHLRLLFDDIDRGAFEVDDEWVSYASAVPRAAVRRITDSWFNGMGQKYRDQQVEVSEAALTAVDDLLQLCKRAKTEGQPVSH